MLLDSVRSLFGLNVPPVPVPPPVAEASPPLAPAVVLSEDDDPVWPTARISVAEALWGEGFLFPGGSEETVRLAKPLGVSAAASLLLIGAGSGGPPRCMATEFGVWVTGYEANAHLAALANERSQRAGLGRRAQVEIWDPHGPKFPPRYFHHGMSLDALRGASPKPMLAGVARALKQGGQFVLVEMVADQPLDPTDPAVTTWARLDHRSVELPSELTLTKALGEFGFDVRIVEDVSSRHMQYVLQGWYEAVQAMQAGRPSRRQLAVVVREAELWLSCVRLMRSGKIRLVRWHAISTAG
jgi:cyclopropane fatty-acyl-phospholipid synthase-like methyltransferase